MYSHNLIISKPGLTESNKLRDTPWLFRLQVPFAEFKIKKITLANQKSKQNFRKTIQGKKWVSCWQCATVGQILTRFPSLPAREGTALMWTLTRFIFFPLCKGCSVLYSFCVIQKCSINKINTVFTGFSSTVKSFILLKLFSNEFQLPFQFSSKTLQRNEGVHYPCEIDQCEKNGFQYVWMLIEDSKVLIFQRTVNKQEHIHHIAATSLGYSALFQAVPDASDQVHSLHF